MDADIWGRDSERRRADELGGPPPAGDDGYRAGDGGHRADEPTQRLTGREHEFPPPPGWEPPPGPPRAVQPPAARPGWTSLVASGLVAAVVSALVTLGVTNLGSGAADGTSFADRNDAPAAPAETAAEVLRTTLPQGSSVAEIAEAALPSVALVDVSGAQGQGSGSAVVYREDGYLITNEHVVRGATQVRVTLPDGTEADAEVVGTDPRSDQAVLRIDADGLQAIPLATEAPEVGDTAIAIGSPFGLQSTVTTGIISALDRPLRTDSGEQLPGLLQTDAAINPGNSGGALLNDRGELIGINTAIVSASQSNSGVGFAVPVTIVESVAPKLIAEGAVEYPYLGVSTQSITASVAEELGLVGTEGALVAQVVPGTPADEAGLQQGDVIVGFNGGPVEGSAELTGQVRAFEPGDEVTVTYVRDGEETEVSVTLDTLPENPPN